MKDHTDDCSGLPPSPPPQALPSTTPQGPTPRSVSEGSEVGLQAESLLKTPDSAIRNSVFSILLTNKLAKEQVIW